MTNKISDKDKKDWEKFINSEEKVIDKDSKSNLKTRQKSKYIDLHGYTLEEANKKIIELSQEPNVILTPHVAGWTKESYYKLSLVLAQKVLKTKTLI